MTDQELYFHFHENLHYDNGFLFWAKKRKNIKLGDEAGTINMHGYLQVSIQNKLYFAHRIIFLMNCQYLPKIIDHMDGDKLNNNINNLRPATSHENGYNSILRINNTSGYKGVRLDKRRGLWRSEIRSKYGRKWLGYFKDKKEAALAYNKAALKYHGEFAVLNIID